MAEATLPSDLENPGNVWCESCQQSLPVGRAAAHVASKKHQQGLAPAEPKAPRARATKTRAPAEAEDPDAEPAEPKAARAPAGARRATKKAATPGGLPSDPNKAGNYWCGICAVSLTAAKAEEHGATARHQESKRRVLNTAMQTLGGVSK